jgi:hypothetical protein
MSSIVVADAGPLHYLVLIDCGEILGRLFDQQTSFFISQEILDAALERDKERREKRK